MICPMVEQAHFGTTRYTMLSLSVIQVPGNPMLPVPSSPVPLPHRLPARTVAEKRAKKPCLFNVRSSYLGDNHLQRRGTWSGHGTDRLHSSVPQGSGGHHRAGRRLTAVGDFMAIHFDARAPRAAYDRIRAALADNPNVTFARRRVKCGWGEWSLVAGDASRGRGGGGGVSAGHAFLHAVGRLHGDQVGRTMPMTSSTRERARLHRKLRFLRARDWIKTGLKEERLIYRHFFNERTQKRLFYRSSGPAAAARPDARDPGRPADHDRQPVVVPAAAHDRGDPRLLPPAAAT